MASADPARVSPAAGETVCDRDGHAPLISDEVKEKAAEVMRNDVVPLAQDLATAHLGNIAAAARVAVRKATPFAQRTWSSFWSGAPADEAAGGEAAGGEAAGAAETAYGAAKDTPAADGAAILAQRFDAVASVAPGADAPASADPKDAAAILAKRFEQAS